MASPSVTLGAINLEARDPLALAAFWASVTGTKPPSGEGSVYLPPASPGGIAMFFQPMIGLRPERQTFHLDLTVPWGSRQREVERSPALGRLTAGKCVQWTTMSDPEGNLFCIAEHPPASR